ncbi:peptide methionine sulfoxide reductase MsrA [Propionigenium maris DSM 9537]|uniref:Peptide methionine sulfoxide reductase MsrA n=2 Tax=Propionigenium TaxID=2332 RepID=A0A9W6GL09_9FUSO|nr:peptide methionine sulfoxide reductase MsrA [Propionigenium maris DSM 9537]
MEAPFESAPGVEAAVSGFAGGEEEFPTYEEVSSGSTGHREAVRVTYDADIISYEELLEIFWKQIDPTDNGGQFVDRGFHYTTAIFYSSDLEREAAERSKNYHEERGTFGDPIVTPILPLTTFYRAEEEHQDYYKNHKLKYKYYRNRSGRDEYLKKIWE